MQNKAEIIKETARRLFMEKGYAATSVRAIAVAAGVSVNTIYNCFGSKEALFHTLDIPEMQYARPEDDKRRSTIIREALLLFGLYGFDEVTMDDIAKRVGVAKPLLYKYFSSKEELFVEALRSTKLASAILQFGEMPRGTPLREAMTVVGERFLALYSDSYRCALLKTIIANSTKFPEIEKHYFEVGIFKSYDVFTERIRKAGYSEEQVEQARWSFIVFIASLNMYVVQYRIMSGAGKMLDADKFLERAVEHMCGYLEKLGITEI